MRLLLPVLLMFPLLGMSQSEDMRKNLLYPVNPPRKVFPDTPVPSSLRKFDTSITRGHFSQPRVLETTTDKADGIIIQTWFIDPGSIPIQQFISDLRFFILQKDAKGGLVSEKPEIHRKNDNFEPRKVYKFTQVVKPTSAETRKVEFVVSFAGLILNRDEVSLRSSSLIK